jgi:hypothetical protein
MFHQRDAHRGRARHHVHHPGGKARLGNQPRQIERAERRILGGLEHHRAAAASAGAIFQIAITSGKFHGMIAPTTPTGWRITCEAKFTPGM